MATKKLGARAALIDILDKLDGWDHSDDVDLILADLWVAGYKVVALSAADYAKIEADTHGVRGGRGTIGVSAAAHKIGGGRADAR